MNSDAVFDCLVLGLGPAGSSFLRLAPPSLRLAALSAPPGPLGKPCGGLLSPDAQAQLARQGLNLPKELLVSPQIFAVHTLDLGSGRSRHYQRSYVNMDRARFDAWLLSLVPERVQRFQGRAQQIRRLENGLFQVEYRNARAERGLLWARRLVGADGAASLVRSSLFPGRAGPGLRLHPAMVSPGAKHPLLRLHLRRGNQPRLLVGRFQGWDAALWGRVSPERLPGAL